MKFGPHSRVTSHRDQGHFRIFSFGQIIPKCIIELSESWRLICLAWIQESTQLIFDSG